MTELNNCCGTTCDKAALADEIAELRQIAVNRTKEAELAKRTANELQQQNTELAAQVDLLQSFLMQVKYRNPEITIPDFLMRTGQCLAEHDREVAARAVEKAAEELASLVTAPAGMHMAAVIKLNLYSNKIKSGKVTL